MVTTHNTSRYHSEHKPYYRTSNKHRPQVNMKRNRLSQWIPATVEDLEICIACGVVLQPNLTERDVIRDVAGKVYVNFQGSSNRKVLSPC